MERKCTPLKGMKFWHATAEMNPEDIMLSEISQKPKNRYMIPFTWSTWRRKWQPTPISLIAECHGHRSLVGYQQAMGSHESNTKLLTKYLSLALDLLNQCSHIPYFQLQKNISSMELTIVTIFKCTNQWHLLTARSHCHASITTILLQKVFIIFWWKSLPIKQ